jgi:hypothetical protein
MEKEPPGHTPRSHTDPTAETGAAALHAPAAWDGDDEVSRSVGAVIEIIRFTPRPGVEEAELLRADRTVQEDFAYQQPGLVRRTTARRGADWVVVELWRSSADADAAEARWGDDPAAQRFMGLIDATSVTVERYEELD